MLATRVAVEGNIVGRSHSNRSPFSGRDIAQRVVRFEENLKVVVGIDREDDLVVGGVHNLGKGGGQSALDQVARLPGLRHRPGQAMPRHGVGERAQRIAGSQSQTHLDPPG